MILDEDSFQMYKQAEKRWADMMRKRFLPPKKRRPIHQIMHSLLRLNKRKKCYYFHATDENHTDAYKQVPKLIYPPSRQIPRLSFIKEAEECLLLFLFQKTIFKSLSQPIRKKQTTSMAQMKTKLIRIVSHNMKFDILSRKIFPFNYFYLFLPDSCG